MAGRRRFDSPWKTIIEALFMEFIELFVPEAHRVIDWAVPVRFLDKEFARVARGARAGSRAVDQLAEVALSDGSRTWVLVHIEIQAQRDADFARRMYRYHLRIFDHFDRQPVSVAILADDEAGWRPTGFGYSRWGCVAQLDFPVVKLTDWADRPEELLRGGNPFGIAAAAHLAALAAGRQSETRFTRRKALYRDMRRMGVSQDKASALMALRYVEEATCVAYGNLRQGIPAGKALWKGSRFPVPNGYMKVGDLQGEGAVLGTVTVLGATMCVWLTNRAPVQRGKP